MLLTTITTILILDEPILSAPTWAERSDGGGSLPRLERFGSVGRNSARQVDVDAQQFRGCLYSGRHLRNARDGKPTDPGRSPGLEASKLDGSYFIFERAAVASPPTPLPAAGIAGGPVASLSEAEAYAAGSLSATRSRAIVISPGLSAFLAGKPRARDSLRSGEKPRSGGARSTRIRRARIGPICGSTREALMSLTPAGASLSFPRRSIYDRCRPAMSDTTGGEPHAGHTGGPWRPSGHSTTLNLICLKI